MKRLLQVSILCLGLVTPAMAAPPPHQGRRFTCEGQSLPRVEHLDVARPPEGRDYGWPANSASVHRWGSEILVAFRDYSHRGKARADVRNCVTLPGTGGHDLSFVAQSAGAANVNYVRFVAPSTRKSAS